MSKLSVVISVYNEEKKIEECLKSVSFADEIIFVDNTSNDKTVDIARSYTSKIFIRPNSRMLNINKNFGFSKTSNEWILNLDSDEHIEKALREEIERIVKEDSSEFNGYKIPRKNIIFGKWIEHTGWYPDYQIRLFKKGKGKFPEKHVHELLKVEGNVGTLKGNIVHYNYETILQFLQKLANIYGPNEAEQKIAAGYKFEWQDSIRFPVKEFLSRFFAREGYKDGFHGLMLSLLMAFYHLIVFVSIWELQGFQEIEGGKILEGVETEFKKANKEFKFWIFNEKLKEIKNPVKKKSLSFLRKLKIK